VATRPPRATAASTRRPTSSASPSCRAAAVSRRVADTTLTHNATLGSSPVTNPTDPALGDDGIIHGADYSGGGSSGTGGSDVMPTSMAAGDGSGGSAPDVTGVAPSTGGGAALAGSKTDANGVQLDMATGQVIGSAAPAMGGELSSAGRGLAGQADPDDGGEDPDVQSMTGGTDAALAMGGADAPMMSDSLSPQPASGGVPPDDDPDAAFGPPGGGG
jgi:hypothetical protein